MSSMDDIDAPRWADFIAPSPQISVDDYFLRNEYRDKIDSVDSDSPLPVKKETHGKPVLNESTFSHDNTMKTPVRPGGAKGSSSNRKNNVKETTYENVLMEAMNNLQLSFKKMPGEKSFNKSCLMDSPAYKTPVKRVTRSMCAQAANTPQRNRNESHHISMQQEKSVKFSKQVDGAENKENLSDEKYRKPVDSNEHNREHNHECIDNQHEIEHEISVYTYENEYTKEDDIEEFYSPSSNEHSSQINLEVTETSTEHEISHEKLDLEPIKETLNNSKLDSSKKVLKSKIVTSFATEKTGSGSGSKKKPTALTGTAWHKQMKRRMSITGRKLSMNKPSAPTKYVSMAEAVSKFQRTTPQRFRSTTVKTTRTEQLRRMSFKLTKATSPALVSRKRVRPITAISRDEKERLEIEQIRQNQIKAKPVPKEILKKPAALRKVEKKMVTNPKPFDLTGTRKALCTSNPNQEYKRAPRILTKTAPSIISADDKGVLIKDEEVLHFGIPCKTKKKSTKVMPFSFEARNRELQMKKQEKLKIMQETEQQKAKAGFHARPVPAAVKTPVAKPLRRENSATKPKITIARSLSFEDRVRELQKKKEEKIKQILEEEKKARTFKAQKVPDFKPVMVRGTSKDNLLKRSNENLSVKSQNSNTSLKKTANNSLKRSRENLAVKQKNLIKPPISIPFVAAKKTSPPSQVTENQENQCRGTVPKILEPKCKLSQKSVAVLTELNIDKRAKERKGFVEQLRKREMEEEELKRKEEEERIATEKEQKMELRKMTEIKARPMPVYKPMTVVKSTKPLTEAQSPAWAKRKGSTN